MTMSPSSSLKMQKLAMLNTPLTVYKSFYPPGESLVRHKPCEASNTDRSTFNAPKPNTRFLKSIIRETNSHNAALRAKEVEDSRARLRNLHDNDGRLSSPKDSYDGLNSESHHRSKRRRTGDEEDREVGRGREDRYSGRYRDQDRQSKASCRKHRDDRYSSEDNEEGEDNERRRRHHHRTHRRGDKEKSYEKERRSKKNRRRSRSRYRSRSRSSRSDRIYHQRHHRSHRSARSFSSASSDSNRHHSAAQEIGDRAPPNTSTNGNAKENKRVTSPGSDSDPLDAIIGPPPPPPAPKVQARGRGKFSSSSAMDSHFSSSYDPSVDVHPDPEMEDDWDQALEAIRDRQRWQKLGAERLKSAGFTEEEVKKWETGGEKREEDVRWKGRGEGREWDRGKVIGDDGAEIRPEWGRLKGT